MTGHEDSNGQTEEIAATTSVVAAAGVTNDRGTLTLEQLEAAMLTLRPQVREVFLAYRLDGMSYQQMSGMRTTKTRHQFYLPDALSAKLDALADGSGGSKTAILTDALTAWFARGAAAEIDQHFGPRFDRLVRAEARVEDKVDILSETLAVFIRHQVTLTAHQPPLDAATRQLGNARYEALLDTIARQLKSRRLAMQRTLGEAPG